MLLLNGFSKSSFISQLDAHSHVQWRKMTVQMKYANHEFHTWDPIY